MFVPVFDVAEEPAQLKTRPDTQICDNWGPLALYGNMTATQTKFTRNARDFHNFTNAWVTDGRTDRRTDTPTDRDLKNDGEVEQSDCECRITYSMQRHACTKKHKDAQAQYIYKHIIARTQTIAPALTRIQMHGHNMSTYLCYHKQWRKRSRAPRYTCTICKHTHANINNRASTHAHTDAQAQYVNILAQTQTQTHSFARVRTSFFRGRISWCWRDWRRIFDAPKSLWRSFVRWPHFYEFRRCVSSKFLVAKTWEIPEIRERAKDGGR